MLFRATYFNIFLIRFIKFHKLYFWKKNLNHKNIYILETYFYFKLYQKKKSTKQNKDMFKSNRN